MLNSTRIMLIGLGIAAAAPGAFAQTTERPDPRERGGAGSKGGGQILENDFTTRRDDFRKNFLGKGGARAIDFSQSMRRLDAAEYKSAMERVTRPETLPTKANGGISKEAYANVEFVSADENARLPRNEQVSVNSVAKACVAWPERKLIRCISEAWQALGAEEKNPQMIHEYHILAGFEVNLDYRLSGQFGGFQAKVIEYRLTVPAPRTAPKKGCSIKFDRAVSEKLNSAVPLFESKGYRVVVDGDADILVYSFNATERSLKTEATRFAIPGSEQFLTLNPVNFTLIDWNIDMLHYQSAFRRNIGTVTNFADQSALRRDIFFAERAVIEPIEKKATSVAEAELISHTFDGAEGRVIPNLMGVEEMLRESIPTCDQFYGR